MCKIANIIVAILLIGIGYKDWKTKRISGVSILIMAFVSIGLRIMVGNDSWWATLGGAAIGFFFFFVSKCSREAVGYGDSWLIFFLGVYAGGKMLLEIVLVAMLLISATTLLYGMRHGWKKKHTLPFVPFLAAAYVGVTFF